MKKNLTDLKIFVIIVSFNGIKYIDNCLQSVLASTLPVRIVVIDNNSTDDTVSQIEKKYLSSNLTLIKQTKNLGFGKANNIGLEYAIARKGDYVFLLNQDACIEPDTIKNLICAALNNQQFGILSPLQINELQNQPKRCFARGEIGQIYSVKFIPAALWLLPIYAVKRIGGFDPSFFHYGEDNDYINRVRFHGLKVGVCPAAVGYHDTQRRIRTNEQNLHLDYVEYKQTVKNLNFGLLLALFFAGLKSCQRSFLYFVALKFKMMFLTLSKYCLVLKDIFRIMKERETSQQVGAYLRQNFDT
jgi:GT2 family glycosyltransferase